MRTAVALFLSVSVFGCVAAPAESEQAASSTARLTALTPVGTFRSAELTPGVYESITFLANGTYRASAVARCLTADCASRTVVEIEGDWTSGDGDRSAQLTLRPSNFARPPVFDGRGGPYILTHELSHARLNYVDEYGEPGLEADRLPTPGTPVLGAPTHALNYFAGDCTSDAVCANSVCEVGAPVCTAFGTCGCAVAPVVLEGN